MDTDPLVLLACIALYATADPSLNTCTYRSPTSKLLSDSIQPSPLPTAFFLLFSPRPSDPTGFSPKVPIPAAQCREVSGPIHFAPVTQSEGARTTYDTPVSLPADHIQVTIIPGGSTSNLVHENTKDKADSDSTGYESV